MCRTSGFIPLLLVYALLTRWPAPLLAAAGYHAFRRVHPARPWPAVRRLFRMDGVAYFAEQRIVFERPEDERMPPDDGRMLAFHPHGACARASCVSQRRCAAAALELADAHVRAH